MSEFVRFIEQQDFEDGLNLRLLVGKVAVGDICKIRFEDVNSRSKKFPLRFAESTISVVGKREDNGFIRLDYIHEALRSLGGVSPEAEFFNQDSIAINRDSGIALRTYLSDEPDARWDGSMKELVDLESNTYIHS